MIGEKGMLGKEQHEEEEGGQKAGCAQECTWSGIRVVSCVGGGIGGEWDMKGGGGWAERREALWRNNLERYIRAP